MFTTPYKLPVSKQVVKYSDFTNMQMFDIIRCLTNNSVSQIENCFDEIISQITSASDDMCNVDKFCLLLDIRSMYLGDQLELQTTDGKKIKMKISTMLENLANQLSNIEPSSIINIGDITMTVGLPPNMLIDDYDKLVEQSIISIHHQDSIMMFKDFTPTEREVFIDSLPAEALHQITQHIQQVQQHTDSLYAIIPNESIGLEGVKIGVYDSSMLQVLRSLYAEDLMNFYEMQFNLITKMRVTYDHFMKMTPSESKIYVNLYNKDIKKQEEAMNKQSQNSHSAGRGIGGV